MDAAVLVKATPHLEDTTQEKDLAAASGQRSRGTHRLGLLLTGLAWILVFSAGVLIDSQPYREVLGWNTGQPGTNGQFDQLVNQLVSAVEAPTTDAPMDVQDAWKLLATVVQQENSATGARQLGTWEQRKWVAFALGMVLFTPLNVALLALLSGFVGGCASNGNESEHRRLVDDITHAQDSGERRALRRRLAYLEEHPIYSMVRSFVVYLVFISGLYVVSSDPFSQETQAQGFTQYIRLAGLVSLLGFVVGYDPTRFKSWLDMIPGPVSSPKAGRDDGTPQQDRVRIEVDAQKDRDVEVNAAIVEKPHD